MNMHGSGFLSHRLHAQGLNQAVPEPATPLTPEDEAVKAGVGAREWRRPGAGGAGGEAGKRQGRPLGALAAASESTELGTRKPLSHRGRGIARRAWQPCGTPRPVGPCAEVRGEERRMRSRGHPS